MNNNNYLNFIYEIASKNYLKERVKIGKYLKDKKIHDSHISKRAVNVMFYICEIEIDENKFLLIDDVGINFLISYTILIGDKTKLVEFKSSEKTYICSHRLFDYVKEHFKASSDSLKEIKPRDLFNKKYKLGFKQPNIIEHLKEYISVIKKLPFNSIHIVKGDLVENFIPTIKTEHLNLAANMNIPLVNLLENNFVRESTINIYDDKKISSIINPLLTYEKKVMWDVYHENDLKLYKDVSSEYVLDFDAQKVIEELMSAQIVNFDRTSIAIQIKNMNSIILSSNHGKYALPVWKSSNEQRFILVENVDAFKAMSGVEFKLETELYEDIYLQTLSGEQAIYKSRFLSEDLNVAFESLEKNQKIEFSSVKELVIKLLYNLEMGVLEICKRENINKNRLNEFKGKINSIIDNVIKTAIMYNKKPKYKRPTDIFEQYYFSVANSVPLLIEKYEKYPSKKDLLDDSLKIANRILTSLKMHKVSCEELYFVCLTIMSLLKVLEIFDKEKSLEFKNLFDEYFSEFKIESKYTGIIADVETLIDDIFFVNKVSKDRDISIYLKRDINTKAFHNVDILDENPRHSSIIKPNLNKLKEMFKYSFEDAAKQISALSIHDIKKGVKLKLRDRDVDLKEDYYSIFQNYSDYKVILENDFFKALVKK